MYFVLMGASFT